MDVEPLPADDGVHFAGVDVVNRALDLEWLPGNLSEWKKITTLATTHAMYLEVIVNVVPPSLLLPLSS